MSSVGLVGFRQLDGGVVMVVASGAGVLDCHPRRKAGCMFSSDMLSWRMVSMEVTREQSFELSSLLVGVFAAIAGARR
jgi:hypothetical protein